MIFPIMKTVRIAASVEVRKDRNSASVSWGNAQGHGKNEAEAIADLTATTSEFLASAVFPQYRWAGSTLFVLYRTAAGWAYDLVRPGNNNASSCLLSVKTEGEALATMLRHVEQECENAAD